MRDRHSSISRRCFLALGSAASLGVLAPAVARGAAPLIDVGGDAFGTGWSVSLPTGSDVSGVRDSIVAVLDGIDFAFSPWRKDSALTRFNATPERDFEATVEIVDVTRSALHIAEASGGHFDPTVGPLVARWGFGPIREGEMPSGGWRDIEAGDAFLSRKAQGLTLDLCGIAKGHALDRVARVLLDAGHDSFLVDLGGELAARGRHPSGRMWQVGIEDPRPDAGETAGTLRLDGVAVATSGDRVNGYEVAGRRYSHIIDPATGEPVVTALASVSVLMPSAREADGWATALMAAGEDGPDIARDLGIPAFFLFRDGKKLRRVSTGEFDRNLV